MALNPGIRLRRPPTRFSESRPVTWVVPTERRWSDQDHSGYVPGYAPFRVVKSAIYAQRVELVARPAKGGTLAYWLRSLLTAEIRGDEAVDAMYAPVVIAVSAAGEKYRLQRTGTCWQAQAACRRMEASAGGGWETPHSVSNTVYRAASPTEPTRVIAEPTVLQSVTIQLRSPL